MIGIILIKPNNEDSELVLILVSNKVEALVFMIINDLFDVTDLERVIQVKECLGLLLAVIQHCIIKRGHDVDCLILVDAKELRLLGKVHIELDHEEDFSLIGVQNYDGVLLSKDDFIWFLVTLRVFEEETHGNLVKLLEFG